ncbi:Shikimate 5-dehydrogenase-like protein HI_0607 [Serratia fonticola]|uniref:Shikimate 5-dehydrogenase-like protein HI_0607 n=1 Tax=Serratia fonticola TaxID=47917 RepID=A0A448T701_SERFO|nr:Shikimate 5-dehydrogenase-like protein HI_0607 [Serratia fonticola]
MSREINKDTQLCMSLAGRPGNFGTRFHNYLYQELDLNFIYKAFTTKDIQAAVGGVRALGIRGCAVSMPFKESCIPFLDELDASATAIESVNTIVNDDGFLRAYNTDYIAIAKLLAKYQIPRPPRLLCVAAAVWLRRSPQPCAMPGSRTAISLLATHRRARHWRRNMVISGSQKWAICRLRW